MTRWLALLCVLPVILAGCAVEEEPVELWSPGEVPQLKSYIERADAVAADTLREANSSESVRRNGGPFTIDDYDRLVSEYTDEGREAVIVMYRLRRPVDFLGHPQHFTVWVYKDTEETRVFGGR